MVEFLNEQLKQVEVLAIELRQFAANNLKAIVPTVYGQTQAAAAQKHSPGRVWDETSLFEKLAGNVSQREINLGKKIYDWMRKDGLRSVKFGTGQSDGSVYPVLVADGIRINPVYLSSNGKLYFQFGSLANKPVFGSIDNQRELMRKLNEIQNVDFSEADLSKYPGIPLSLITQDPAGPSKIMSALHWIDERIEDHR